MAQLKRTTYRVELEDGESVYEVTVILGDLLRAELEGPRHGITDPRVQAIHTTVLWLWAASLRSGKFADSFPAFKVACTNFEPIRETEVQGVPPTSPASSPAPTLSLLPNATDTPTPLEHGSDSSTAPTTDPSST